MKLKIIILSLILQFIISNIYADTNIVANKIKLNFINKVFSKIVIYKNKLSKIYYFPVKVISKMYNGKIIYTHKNSVYKIVKLYIKNNEIIIQINTNKVIIRNKVNVMSAPSKIINKEVYVPYDFFSIKDFINITTTIIDWDQKKSKLNVVRIPNITVLEYYIKPYQTQILLHCTKLLKYTILKKTLTNIYIKILNGKVPKKDYININDGIIKYITCDNLYNDAIIKINFKENLKNINITTYKNRININITHINKVTVNNTQKVYYFIQTSKAINKINNKESINTINNISFYKKKK
jgi:hypothetical protein